VPSNSRQTPVQPTTFPREKPCTGGINRLHAVAAAVVLCTSLAHTGDAMALALGRIVVQSALGEPLRAEIEVPEISAEEASSLRVGLATPAAFRAAGMDFNQALGSAQLTLERRPDGRAYLRLTSPRPVNEPFVDLMIEANWASGRIVRDYTLLIDPPKTRAAVPVAPVPAAAATQPVRPPAAVGAQTLPPVTAPAARTTVAPRAAAPNAGPTQVRVRSGDTAGRIAEANRPANVSLDQMLVAMLRANPSAFIGDNVNRIKAGAVIDLPQESAAASVSSGEARQIIAAQSRDFDEFRRRLAGRVPATAVDTGSREAAGQVQAEVQEQKSVAPAQDKLTLSKGAAPAVGAAEDKIAQERQAKDAATRVAELSRNVEELAKLNGAPAAATPGAAAPSAPTTEAPGAAVTAPAALPVPAETTPATATAEPPAVTTPPVDAPAEQPAAAPVTAPAPVPAPIADEPSLLDQLQENPLVLPAAGGLLALLAGFGLYRMRQRKKGSSVDSSFLESRLQPDSFFGSSGGQRIDTAEATASGSSMVYSPSQLDAAGDVDPVAEADVYLAYGRDLQAEEILKEAMRSTPSRVAIHNKLLEIYAKRRDAKAFEVVATEAFSLTQGQGPEWDHACELGRELDPNNPLYQPGGAPAERVVALTAAGGAMTQPFGVSTLEPLGGGQGSDGGLDLDLDFSTDDTPASSARTSADVGAMSALDDLGSTDALTHTPVVDLTALESRPMDFDLDFPSEPAALGDDLARGSATQAPISDQPMFDLGDSLPSLNFDAPQELSTNLESLDVQADVDPSSPLNAPSELMSFDLSDASLDLEAPAPDAAADDSLTEENPLDTKLSLAEEFRAIGDLEGARSLAEEVLAEASGTLKTKASTFLADLG
jgi:pilus assembly protein FimV